MEKWQDFARYETQVIQSNLFWEADISAFRHSTFSMFPSDNTLHLIIEIFKRKSRGEKELFKNTAVKENKKNTKVYWLSFPYQASICLSSLSYQYIINPNSELWGQPV